MTITLLRRFAQNSASRIASVLIALTAFVGCNADRLNIPNFNESPVDQVADRALLQNAVSGILGEQRAGMAGLVSNVGIFGRESYNYTSSEPRNITLFLATFPLDNSGFTNGQWDARFRNMRNTINVIRQVAPATFINDAEKNAVRGFANTMRALDLFYVIATRDSLGVPTALDSLAPVPQPFVSRDSVYRFISATLDQAATQLAGAGTVAFPFRLTTGFAGFDTPATFIQFNRALAARVLVYRGSLGCGAPCYTQALTALSASFINSTPTGDLRRGVYHVYSAASGDLLNGISRQTAPDQLSHPSIRPDAQRQVGGVLLDNRFVTKVRTIPTRNAPGGIAVGIPTDVDFNLYVDQTTSIPIIRNEELILLRAESNVGLGQFAAALTDINDIRARAGNLPPILSFASPTEAVDAILYERRYSLLWEGHRWFDVRRYNRINTLPLDIPTHFRVRVMPVPQAECLARQLVIGAQPDLRAPGCP